MTTQGDLFTPPAIGISQEEAEDRAAARRIQGTPPNPLDGLVHSITWVHADKGTRTIDVKCGAILPKFRTHDTLAGATAFNSRVTCPECKLPPCPPERNCPTCNIQQPELKGPTNGHPQ